MNITQAEQIAKQLMREHLDYSWRFKWSHAVRQYGVCVYTDKTIMISRKLTELNGVMEFTNTMLHEIAHALTPTGEHHGKAWQAMAKSIGCDGERCYSDSVIKPPKKYSATCPHCARVIQRHRLSPTLSCGKCCRLYNHNHYSADYLFSWRANR